MITATRQLPPVVDAPEASHLVLFTDGSARHSSIPPARLTYWGVIRAVVSDAAAWLAMDLHRKTMAFQAVVMGATPGAQTVPRAEHVVDLCGRLAALDSAAPVPSLPHVDLFQPLVGLSRLHVYKVKAHNTEGAATSASARLQWLTAGNGAADALARSARQQEWDLVQR